MRFKMPETLDGLTLAEITKLSDAAAAEAAELNAIADDKITDEESQALIELVGHLGTLSDRETELSAEAATRAEKLAEARAALAEKPAEKEDEPEDEPEVQAEDEPEAQAEQKELEEAIVAAAAQIRKNFSAKVGEKSRTKEPTSNSGDEAPKGALSIVASANVPGFVANQSISFDQLAEAYAGRARAFATGSRVGQKALPARVAGNYKLSKSAQRYSVAKLVKGDNEFTITEKMSAEDQYDLIMRAASEKRLGGGSLVAAGGWCAPSEQVWGFLELESAEGLLSIAEINSRRGGIQYTKGPQLGTLLLDTDLGWTMTEAQAEAGSFTKPIFDIECPDWDETRMVAVGYALRAGLLTDTAYPELLRRYLALATIVHARRMNAATINRISGFLGATTTFAPVGAQPSATADLLSAIELNAIRIREQYSMPLRASVEGIFPIWALAVVRSDLSRRTGVDLINVSDQMITKWFTDRKVNAQFVRDYQSINTGAANTPGGTAGWTRFPDKVEFMLYPAGSFVRLGTPVIDLDTVYDVDNLTKNQFLAAFFEEGFEVANTGGSGVKVTVGLPNLFGSTGYPSIGALANVAPTP